MSRQNELQQIMVDKTIDFYKKDKRGYLDLAMRFGKINNFLTFNFCICQ